MRNNTIYIIRHYLKKVLLVFYKPKLVPNYEGRHLSQSAYFYWLVKKIANLYQHLFHNLTMLFTKFLFTYFCIIQYFYFFRIYLRILYIIETYI